MLVRGFIEMFFFLVRVLVLRGLFVVFCLIIVEKSIFFFLLLVVLVLILVVKGVVLLIGKLGYLIVFILIFLFCSRVR